MTNLKKVLLLAGSLALFSTLCSYAQYATSVTGQVSLNDLSSNYKNNSLLLMEKLLQVSTYLDQSNKEIASLELQLTQAKLSSTKSAQRIENLETLLSQAKELQQSLESTILDLQKQLTAAGITVEQQKTEIEKLNTSLQNALTYSSNLEQITSDLNVSIKKDQLKIKGLEIEKGFLIGGCVVTFAGGVVVGVLIANAMSK